jgi:farnesyl diphosphate synthase
VGRPVLITTEVRAPDIRPSLAQIARQVDEAFDALLPLPSDGSRRLYEAMRHAAIGGGKRLRPLLVVASAALFDVAEAHALRAGIAVECLHIHSLIHDDLPCMDDDDMRRGKPTVHRAFDEATAVLAGDALHALAFEILADPATHPVAAVRAELVLRLARTAGAAGMAGGQMLDLRADQEGCDVNAVTRSQRLKTGGLIAWCLDAGGTLAQAPPQPRESLRGYAHCLGLAFQIRDDLLDVEGREVDVGKRLRKDALAGKVNLVSIAGVSAARQQAGLLADQAVEHLAGFGTKAELLRRLARFAITRDH